MIESVVENLDIKKDLFRRLEAMCRHTLTRLVQLGYLGKKTGTGFYDYSQSPPVQNPSLTRPVV